MATTELRFFVPTVVANWLDGRAHANFQKRNVYLRAMLVQLYRKANPGTDA